MYKIIKATPLIIFLILCFSFQESFSQAKKKKPETVKRDAERHSIHSRDSLLRSFNKSDTSINNLLQRIEQYITTFNQINNNLAEGLDTTEQSQQLSPYIRRINKIDSLINTHKSSTLRYLFVLRDNLDHMQEAMDGWQSDLEDVSTRLVQNQTELIKFSKDTSLNVTPSDSAIREAFFAERRSVRLLYRKTDSVNRASLLKLNLLQDKISVAYTRILDETDQIDAKIRRFAMKAINGESDYIWNTSLLHDDFKPAFNSTIKLNRILFNYFLKNETPTHYAGVLFFILMLSWIMFVRAKTLRNNENPQVILDQANFISKMPLIASLLLGTAIIPYFYDHPPVVFLQTLFLVTIILTLIFVKRSFPASAFNFLLRLFFLTIIYGLSNLFIQISNVDRYVILVLSILSIILAYLFYKKVKNAPQDHLPYTGLALRTFIILQVLSFLLNVSGRFSLAKIIGVTAAFNLWMLVVLFFVVQIIVQGLFLQFQVKKDGHSFIDWIDYNIVQKKFRNILVTFASLLWLFFLLQNLNIDDWASDNITDLLGQSRSVGNASFTFGGFVIFIAVIWLSSIVSKIISYFYDVSAQRVTDLSVAKKKNRTSTLLIKLGVFSIGFLLAVAASGFPLEKLTIVISAFGIGIGFGLQTIVNNLVSGLILAFEKPIQIGDIIEVDGRAGTMKEIGIRSSRILTYDGSEVIIPNADLISHHVVNWTLSNSNRRIELLISTAYGSDIDMVKSVLKDLLIQRDDIMKSPGPSIFLNALSENAAEFRVFFWAADISTTLELKSKILVAIHNALMNAGISIPSARKDLYLHFPDGEQIIGNATKPEENKVEEEPQSPKKPNKNPPGQGQ